MQTRLLVFKKVVRDKFIYEDFTPKDPILGIVNRGGLIFDEGNGEIEVGEKECILFRKGVRYLRRVTRPLEMYLFRFSTDVNIFTSSCLPKDSCSCIASVLQDLEELCSRVCPQELFCQQAILNRILMLYVMADTRKRQDGTTGDAAIDRFLTIVHSDIQSKLNLAAIAQDLGMSYVQFLRRFRSALGTCPAEYVAQHRLSIACKHLRTTSQPIKSIALACGYQDAYYFSNAFKKRYGLSPSAYRNLAPENEEDFL